VRSEFLPSNNSIQDYPNVLIQNLDSPSPSARSLGWLVARIWPAELRVTPNKTIDGAHPAQIIQELSRRFRIAVVTTQNDSISYTGDCRCLDGSSFRSLRLSYAPSTRSFTVTLPLRNCGRKFRITTRLLTSPSPGHLKSNGYFKHLTN